jgi:hypothetical protein
VFGTDGALKPGGKTRDLCRIFALACAVSRLILRDAMDHRRTQHIEMTDEPARERNFFVERARPERGAHLVHLDAPAVDEAPKGVVAEVSAAAEQ